MKNVLILPILSIFLLSGSIDHCFNAAQDKAASNQVELSKSFVMSKKFLIAWTVGSAAVFVGARWIDAAIVAFLEKNPSNGCLGLAIGSIFLVPGGILTGKCIQAAVQSKSNIT